MPRLMSVVPVANHARTPDGGTIIHAGRRHLRLMLLTSCETQRWVIPKGWPMRGRKPSPAGSVSARATIPVGLRPVWGIGPRAREVG
jgi:hypothetical protein